MSTPPSDKWPSTSSSATKIDAVNDFTGLLDSVGSLLKDCEKCHRLLKSIEAQSQVMITLAGKIKFIWSL